MSTAMAAARLCNGMTVLMPVFVEMALPPGCLCMKTTSQQMYKTSKLMTIRF